MVFSLNLYFMENTHLSFYLLFDLIIKKENKEERIKGVDKLKTYDIKILSFHYQLLVLSFTQYDSILKVSVSVF